MNITNDTHPALARLSNAERALGEARDLHDIKKIIDIAEAARTYARAAKLGEAAAQHAAEIKLRAQRKAGEFLSALEKGKGGGDQKSENHSAKPERSSFRKTIDEVEVPESTARRYQKISAIPEATFHRYLQENKEPGQELSTGGLLRDVQRAEKETKRQATREQNAELVGGVRDPLSLGDSFQTIVLDPPWDWGDEGDVDQMGRARPTYNTMPIEEIAALPVGELSAKNAHVYLWITNRSMPKGFALLERWGFRYVTMLTWEKPSFGMGNYFRGNTEHVLFGVKGSLPLLRNDCPTLFKAQRPGPHSAKPPEFFQLVETCSPGPWLEMFARQHRPGWISWGAEAQCA